MLKSEKKGRIAPAFLSVAGAGQREDAARVAFE
jgi:hypothetical protein